MAKLILLVDDESDIREMLTELLNDEGYTCVSAESVSTAIQEINNLSQQSTYFDLIISDLNMPGGSGIDLLKMVRNMKIDAPFLFLSGESADEELKPYLSLGVCGYQLKPFRSLDFLKRLNEILKDRL
jgi:CheY-like chemotaxis protein